MKIIISLCFFILVISSCNNDKNKVERQKVHLEIIHPDLEIQFPGQLVAENNCLLLFDPFASSNNIKILDKLTGEKKFEFLDTGNGPKEFVTPWCGYSANDTLTIIDLNAQKKVEFDVNDLCMGVINVEPISFPHNNAIQLARIGINKYIAGTFEDEYPFCLIKDNKVVHKFGRYPISTKIANTFDAFQGTILFNEERGLIGYATFSTPYLALYKLEEENPNLLWESEFAPMRYTISDQQLNWDNDQPVGIHEFAFTKDYIACLVKEMELRNSAGRSEEQMPQTIYLYNYDGILIKILELDYPSIRLCSDASSNDIYLISLNQEYCLSKIEL